MPNETKSAVSNLCRLAKTAGSPEPIGEAPAFWQEFHAFLARNQEPETPVAHGPVLESRKP